MWDIALKYAADWNSIKVSAAAGWTQLTDEGCSAPGVFHGGRTCSNVAVVGGGGAPFQNYRQDGQLFQIGASVLHFGACASPTLQNRMARRGVVLEKPN